MGVGAGVVVGVKKRGWGVGWGWGLDCSWELKTSPSSGNNMKESMDNSPVFHVFQGERAGRGGHSI